MNYIQQCDAREAGNGPEPEDVFTSTTHRCRAVDQHVAVNFQDFTRLSCTYSIRDIRYAYKDDFRLYVMVVVVQRFCTIRERIGDQIGDAGVLTRYLYTHGAHEMNTA